MEEDDSDRPDIGLTGVDLSLQDLGSHVDWRALHGLGQFIGIFQGLAEAEISYFDASIMKEDIIWFDIPVHDITSGEDFEGLEDLPKVDEGFLFGEDSLFLHEFVESTAVAVFIDEVEIISGFEHVDVLDNVGAVLESGEDVDLVDRALFQFGYLFELLGLDDLDGDLLLVDQVDGLVDLGVDPFSQLFLEFVVLYDLSHK